jgi:AcrR family transcriptional regulator
VTRTDQAPRPPRRTRAEQRAATHRSLLEAASACLREDGYAALTTRNVAARAGVSQSTLMHYFPTRAAFLVEAVTYVATELATEAIGRMDLDDLRAPDRRDAILDQAWQQFTSPGALAAVQLWNAAWTEPEIATILRELEERITGIIATAAAAVLPGQADDPNFAALIDATVSMIRGLVIDIPIMGLEVVDARWRAIKPLLLRAAADLLDPSGPSSG